MWKISEREHMKKMKDSIKNAASYSSGDALKLFSQCAEIQLTLRANFMTSLSCHVLWRQRCTSTRLKMSEPATYHKDKTSVVYSKRCNIAYVIAYCCICYIMTKKLCCVFKKVQYRPMPLHIAASAISQGQNNWCCVFKTVQYLL